MKNSININSNFKNYIEIFKEENSKLNLISKNDEKFLYEKHIYDSLGIKLFFEKYNYEKCTILDIGCGGGFPSVPIAIEYPEFNITGIDSINKKISAVNNIKEKLKLENLNLICGRIEDMNLGEFDIVVSRAVADLSKIIDFAIPNLKHGGYLIAYKAKKADEEIKNANSVLKKYNAKISDIFEYNLPMPEIYERKLICIVK